MGEYRSKEHKPFFRIHRDMIIYSVKVIGSIQSQALRPGSRLCGPEAGLCFFVL